MPDHFKLPPACTHIDVAIVVFLQPLLASIFMVSANVELDRLSVKVDCN